MHANIAVTKPTAHYTVFSCNLLRYIEDINRMRTVRSIEISIGLAYFALTLCGNLKEPQGTAVTAIFEVLANANYY